ncbi:Protein of uncharacterised function (DUF2910) [Mycolicibacterium flavescens]|nr:Protein of uncharacterised function (DUF2910) [Mycolicibacterium flavescens]
MALAVSLEPFRVGMTVVMLNRPRPALHLLAFIIGGFVMGISVGAIVLFVLRPPLASGNSTLPWVQIVVGAVVLINAALVYTGIVGRSGGIASPGPLTRMSAHLAARARRLLDSRSLWTAGVAGLGIALPSVDYLAALALIVASGTAATIQFGALILFNVVAFALVEIPLLCYLVAPDRTRATLSALYDWVREQGRRGVSLLLVAVGGVLLAVGFAGL